jgi:streptogramin lyase
MRHTSSFGIAVMLCWTLWACSADVTGNPEDATVDPDVTEQDGGSIDVRTDLADTVDACVDLDEDGFGDNCDAGPDCNDQNADVNPGTDEICGDEFDNNCNERVDENCVCVEGQVEDCYEGDESLRGIGRCQVGIRVCVDADWTECNHGEPAAEVCDGVDNNCDGVVDEGVSNACGGCGPPPPELCGNFQDDDCNGLVDELAECTCTGRTNQPCYSGPPRTLGYGVCIGGIAICEEDRFAACLGEVLPTAEICDGLDNDCDGLVDEGLANSCGECGAAEPVEVCDGVDNDCDGTVDEGLANRCGLCNADSLEEVCADGLDNDCDGQVDEACSCQEGAPTCWTAAASQRGVGVCADGTRSCDEFTGEFWTECAGAVLPTPEICDGLDNDCDGQVDESSSGCSVCGAADEICDGIDNDCDGQVDEFLRNPCGQCRAEIPEESACGSLCCDGIDNDCDGLVDEGLVNICGQCGSPCFSKVWTQTPDWSEGRLDGVEVDGDGAFLRLGARLSGLPYLWVANSGEATVSRINTVTLAEEGRFPVGQSPSRTAVDFDGNVFVANRAFFGQGTLSRVNATDCSGAECVTYTAPVGPNNAIPRGVAVDANGFPWVGTYNDFALRQIDPNTGLVLGSWFVGVPVYGIAIDSDGIIWFTSLRIPEFTGGLVGGFDTNTNTLLGTWEIPGCSNPYGIAVDADGGVWLGNFTCNNLVRFDRAARTFETFDNPSLERTRGVAIDGDGRVWVASYGTDRVALFDPGTRSFVGSYPVCDGPTGVGIDNNGRPWVPCYLSNDVVQVGADGSITARIAVGQNPYSYSDLTGFQLRNFTARRGFWNVELDCGSIDCVFNEVLVAVVNTADTELLINARVSNDQVTWSPWAGPFPASSAQLDGLPSGRHIEIELLLRTRDRLQTPIVETVEVYWSRP